LGTATFIEIGTFIFIKDKASALQSHHREAAKAHKIITKATFEFPW